ncbi:MAG: hypothetical protein AB2A00_17650 [Myxococcota bacterium]
MALLPLVLAACACTAWLLPGLLGQQVFYGRDMLLFRLPYLEAMGKELRAGRWPTWTDDIAGGVPLWHHPSAELADPSALLATVLDPYQTYAARTLFHVLLALLGVWLLARSLGAHRLLATWAAVLYVGSGPAASLWTVKFIPTSALPWLCVGVVWTVRSRRWRGPLTLALATAGAMLHPDPPALVGAAILAVALGLSVTPRSARRRAVMRCLAATTIGVLLAGPFLVPALLTLQDTARGEATALGSSAHFDPTVLLDVVAPGARGIPTAVNASAAFYAQLSGPRPFIFHMFFGMTAVALLLARRKRVSRVDVFLGGAALLLALMSDGTTLPGVDALWRALNARYPDKVLLPAVLALQLVAARTSTRGPPGRREWGLGALAVGGLALLLAAPGMADSLTVSLMEREAGIREVVRDIMRTRLIEAGTLIVVAALALMLGRRWRGMEVALGMVTVLGASEAAACLGSLCRTTDAARVRHAHALLDVPPMAPVPTFVGEQGRSAADIPFLIRRDSDEDFGNLSQVALGVPASGLLSGARYPVGDELSGIYALSVQRLLGDVLPHLPSGLLANVLTRLGIQRMWIRDDGETPQSALARPGHHAILGRTHWWELHALAPLPDVHVETAWEVEREVKAATLRLAHPNGPRVVLSSGAPPDDPSAAAEWRVVQRSPTRVDVHVTSRASTVLIQHAAWHPAWEAEVDGAPVPLELGNLAQRAVRVPPGSHDVTLRHRMRGVTAGWLLGALGLVLLAAWCLRARVATRGGVVVTAA